MFKLMDKKIFTILRSKILFMQTYVHNSKIRNYDLQIMHDIPLPSCILVLKGDLMKVKKHLRTLRSKMTHASRQDNKFQQDAQVCDKYLYHYN